MYTAQTILKELLDISPFPGWKIEKLHDCVNEKISRLEFDLLFPYGAESLVTAHQAFLKNLLLENIKQMPIELGVTGKIRWIVQQHFQNILKYSEAERAIPQVIHHPSIALKTPDYIAELTDIIWRTAGDHSIDMNYYTKRISLGVIYLATLSYWHQSHASIEEIMNFFDHRLEDLKKLTSIGKKYTFSPDNLLKNIRLLKAHFWDR
ncbi:MAG: COQ9 family protein [Candidatus Paracaedibacteraceae bacterium]|nr:COQ9 family protein [Candidatus Paracaedibacteraceae bacterium]